MDYKDYYKTLGVSKTASEKEIKAAYRKLARKHHPDMNQGNAKAEARFKEINEAYEVLSDPEKRKKYDHLGADWKSYARQPAGTGARAWPGGGGGGFRVEYDIGGGGPGAGFSDFFKTFFGGGGFGGFGGAEVPEEPFGSVRAADVEHAVELTLLEVLKGATRILAIGEGPKPRQVEVKIPAGVREGQRVRVAGEGAAGRGGKRGDLYLRVRLRPDPAFERKGDDLQTTVRVPLTTAVLGGEAQVPTLEGPVGIKVPPGTSVGQTFRLRGHGLPRLESGGGRGDLLASLAVDLPKQLSDKEKELFEELRRLGV